MNMFFDLKQHIGYFGEVEEGDVVSVWQKKTGNLLYQVLTHRPLTLEWKMKI